MSLPFKVKAVYEYTSPHDDDLHFPTGQIITVTEEEDDDWYAGEYVDASGAKQEGIFPRNFVEKYEPTAPPRPVRQSRPKQPAPAPVSEPVREPTPEPDEPEPEIQSQPAAREQSPPPPAVAAVSAPKPAEVSPPAAPKPAPAASRSVPPPVSDKPSGGSFRDRIAAFNKAAPPVAPFKPGGLGSGGSSGFIKKPFVAPPPSKNAYVPPPRETPVAKVYRRDEDPEIAAKETENQEQAERAGLATSSTDADAEDQPKPTSLKERIALLQKQQAEQAARHAEAAQKKEKPKRPVKKRTESSNTQDGTEEGDGAVVERQGSEDAIGKASMDSVREEGDAPRRRKSSRGATAIPGIPHRMPVADGNEADMSGAGYTTEEPEEMSTARDDSDDKPAMRGPLSRASTAPTRQPDVGDEEGTPEEPTSRAEEDEEDEDEDEEVEDDDVDPEVRRREELRARMAKMSGGMGMHGMFGPPGGMPMPGMLPPKKKKTTSSSEARSGSQAADDAPAARAPAVPMIPMPGLSRVRSPEDIDRQLGEDDEQTPIARTRPAPEILEAEESVSERGAPPVPGGRPAPPPVPKESRPVPPPPTMIENPSLGSESDDEMSESTQNLSLATPTAEAPRPPARPSEAPGSPPPPPSKRASVLPGQAASISPPQTGNKDKRMSRAPPPIPGAAMSAPAPAPQARAPPPPPPTGSLSRSSTADHSTSQQSLSDEEEVTEYDGDYDTDIASAVPHKDALKAHATDDSFDDSSTGRAPMGSPPSAPPPLPSVPAPPPRGAPPPLPSQPPPSRASADVPRAAPPPPPPSKGPAPWEEDDNEYDPFRYSGPTAPSHSTPAPRSGARDEDLYSSSPPRSFIPPLPSQERAAPPPPPPREPAPAIALGVPPRGLPRQSLDVNRGPTRRSTDLSRMSMESGFVANDVDLGRNTFWWTQPKTLPPSLQGRKDVLIESEESTSSAPDGKPCVAKDIYVLFQDYSQTIVSAQFSAQDPADVKLEQRHEPPPSRLRQDQLEEAHEQFGRRIYETVTAKRETVVGDGTPHGLIQELLGPFADAVPPVGTRAYGALVYANLANASTQQNDEIRPGDILTLRNAKFQGKHGAMHAKYSMEVGKPDHVGVVAEWDGTKKKVRAWEQGRESKKVKMESFKLDDLRSGEVKVWRVMPRSWVGWAGRH